MRGTSRRCVLRRLPVALVCSGLFGCGFQPIYSRNATGLLGPAQAGLAAIQIGNIPNRPGQLLREALQQRFEREGAGVAHIYDLYIAFGISNEGISVQPDSSVTRNRIVGTASWTLVGQDPARSKLTSGIARSIDGVDVVNEQFFAVDLNTEVAQTRICEAIADQIELQLASYFRKRALG